MQTLYKPKAYSDQMRKIIMNSGQIGITLANRWMLGWPETANRLLAANEYQAAFQYQLEQEQDALAAATDSRHLTPTEIVAMAGLPMAPPAIS